MTRIRNDRDAHAEMVAFNSTRPTCPPCTGECEQGDTCPNRRLFEAHEEALAEQAHRETRFFAALAFVLGVAIVAAIAGTLLGLW